MLPLAKDIADFDFADTPVNEALIRVSFARRLTGKFLYTSSGRRFSAGHGPEILMIREVAELLKI